MLMAAVESYLEVRYAAGFELRNAGEQLRNFARFAAAQGDTHVVTSTAIAWATQAPSVHTRDTRLKLVIRFARHSRAEDAAHEIPPDNVFAAPRSRRLPHIFPPHHLRQILEEAGELPPAGSLRPHTYKTLFGLLASCGLRISEALMLRLDDLTPDGLLIRKTKFRKSRLVPMHPTTERAVADYLSRRSKIAGDDDHVFVSVHNRKLGYRGAQKTFLKILRKLGLRGAPGEPGPTLHDLRHTAAVRALEDCAPDQVATHLLALSTYLGHAHISDTYWYLHVTPQLLAGISDACQTYLDGGTP